MTTPIHHYISRHNAEIFQPFLQAQGWTATQIGMATSESGKWVRPYDLQNFLKLNGPQPNLRAIECHGGAAAVDELLRFLVQGPLSSSSTKCRIVRGDGPHVVPVSTLVQGTLNA